LPSPAGKGGKKKGGEGKREKKEKFNPLPFSTYLLLISLDACVFPLVITERGEGKGGERKVDAFCSTSLENAKPVH